MASKVQEVPLEARGERLDRFLARTFPDLSRARLQSLIAEGRVTVDGRAGKAAGRLRGGEQIALTVPPPAPVTLTPEDLPIQVLYQDAELAVLDKAAGMVVHPGAGHASGTLVNALLKRLSGMTGIGGELRPGLVHRLDKDTSGCLVVAKTERALVSLQAAFKSRQVEKRYLALVRGAPPDQGRIETLFGRHPVHRQRFTGKVTTGRPAVTLFHARERYSGAALVEVDLRTGRTHQIRVHLSELGHPLLGDRLYGGRSPRQSELLQAAEAELGRQALHAWRLSFVHPTRGEPMTFEAPLPEPFVRALEVLRAAAAGVTVGPRRGT